MQTNQFKHSVVSVAGDGIGPAIMTAVQDILRVANAPILWVEHELGRAASPQAIQHTMTAFRDHRVMLKGPTETPVATKGQKSFNVTCRKGNGLYVNMRRSISLHPIVPSSFPTQDITIFRENEEGLYAAVEHRHTPDGLQAISMKSITGMHRIIRAAFEYALLMGKKRVCCLHKGNILKLTEGTFLDIFNTIAKDYPHIQITSQIIDDGMAKVATAPDQYEVIVTENLFGDILSDIATQLTGSLGMGGSANIGARAAMFEAIHGSAPDIVPGGKLNKTSESIANPSGLLQAALLMLCHLDRNLLPLVNQIQTAWAWTLEDGVHTIDIARGGTNPMTQHIVGTVEWTQAVCDRLLQLQSGSTYRFQYLSHTLLKPIPLLNHESWARLKPPRFTTQSGHLLGMDVMVEWTGLHELEQVLATQGICDTFATFANAQAVFDYVTWWEIGEGIREAVSPELSAPTIAHLKQGRRECLQAMLRYLLDQLTPVSLVGGDVIAISSRGQLIYPDIIEPDLTDQIMIRIRFSPQTDLVSVLQAVIQTGVKVISLQGLHRFDGDGDGFFGAYGESAPPPLSSAP